ncbi:MAG TPA: DNAase [Gallionella sp.]|jgi:TatD DNase family protein|nr:TatD family hydrolase [Gallionella sp.]OGS66160.1 MAG: DNAase [Gallionellales bacterium GWA2_54_124]HCI52910.1 DNAase [Gallionella sp.]
MTCNSEPVAIALIDTHCHLDAAEFAGHQAEIMRAAKTAGISHIVVPSVTRDRFAGVSALCDQHPECSAAFGIHPMFIESAKPDDLLVLRETLLTENPVAVGEIGLDFFVTSDNRARQEYFFVEQLKLAREFDLPVLLHTRRATDTVLKHLRQNAVRGGIAHAFSGSREQADEFIKLGFKLGFGGAATFLRATRLRELATTLPLSCLVLETDAPDMPPEFVLRGSPNKPEYLLHIAETLASLRGISLTELALATTANARSVLAGLPR